MKSVPFAMAFPALLAAATLSACGPQEARKDAPGASTTAAAPDAKPGITVSGAVLMLPIVDSRPGAAYFTVTNGGNAATSLAAVHIDGAGKTELHETKGGKMEPIAWLDIAPGTTATFERGGRHVMVFDLSDTLKSATSTEMTLTFSGGDKVSVPMKVQKMADAAMGAGH